LSGFSLRAMFSGVADALIKYPGLAVLGVAFVLGACVSLALSGPHPFVVVRRVSIPYGVKVGGAWVAALTASWVAVVAGVTPFLRVRSVLRYWVVLACLVFLVGVVGGVAALVGGRWAAYFFLSLYVAGIPSAKVWYVVLVVCAGLLVASLVTRVKGLGLSGLLGVKVFDGGPLTVGEAVLAWLVAFIVLMAPYYPWLNPRGVLVDVDHIYYWRWLQGTDWSNVTVRLLEFNRGDRPLFVGFVFLVTRLVPFRVFDVLYIAGAGALVTVLAEGVCRRLGVGEWFGFAAALLASVPLYFVFGGYHANLAAMCLALITLYWRLGWGESSVSARKLVLLGVMSLATAATHSEAWVLYTPLFLLDAPTFVAWVAGGASWLVVRELLVSPKYALLARNLLAHGAPTITQLDFQLVIMLWGVPATWLTYLLVTAGLIKVWRDGALSKYFPFVASTALALVPLLTLTPRFMVHRVLMNTAYWVFAAYALSRAWGSRKWWWAVPLYVGLQWLYVAWLLSNAAPAKPP